MKLWANCLVKNEERFLWYSVDSVINYVEKVLLWDTGSSDATLDIIKELQKKYPGKIVFREIGDVNSERFTKIRQEMLNESVGDWILVLDGDEIWWEDSIRKLISVIDEDRSDVIVVPFVNLIGDIFHYQDESAGRYKIDGRTGNITVKAFKKNISGLKTVNPYGSEGYTDVSGLFLQESEKVKREFVNSAFLHTTHLVRSSKDFGTMGRRGKVKHELGIPFPLDFYFPEAFFRSRPVPIESPWKVMNAGFARRAFIETPLRRLNRKFIHNV